MNGMTTNLSNPSVPAAVLGALQAKLDRSASKIAAFLQARQFTTEAWNRGAPRITDLEAQANSSANRRAHGYFAIEDRDAFSPEFKKIRVVTTAEYFLED